MPQPQRDYGDVHASLQQPHRRRVPDHVRRYRPIGQFRDLGRTPFDQAIDPEAGERRPEPADEHGVFARATGDLVRQNAFGFRP